MLSVIFFLDQSPLYLLKRGLSLNADLADSMRLASQLCRGLPLLLESQVGHHASAAVGGC